MENEKVCTLLINGDTKIQPSPMDIQKKIEQASSVYMQKKDAKKLVEALEELLLFMVNGNSYPRLLMTIIRFAITCDDHRVKKLLSLYWEICDKVKDTGELKEEMVLVCNAIRNDLIHANEYIRGRTLRMLCRMRYFKILEPLIESILKNLSHRHAYVRRNAVTCVYSIVKTFGPEVIPAAAVEIEQLLLVEGDLSTKRIAFVMLLNCDIDRAINYALSVEEQVTSLGDVFQLAILELVRKASRSRPSHKARLMKLVFYLANGSSPAVMFECAEILSRYGTSPSATQIAASSYVHLLNSQPDNNVKLIVLDKLELMRLNEAERHVVEGLAMDILRGLGCPALGVRRKIITLVGELFTGRNIHDVVILLKKEIVKSASPENAGAEGIPEYRRLLIGTLQEASRKFPDFADSVVSTLCELLQGEASTDHSLAFEVVSFLREVMCNHSHLRPVVMEKLVSMLPDLARRSRVVRTVIWLIGEFSVLESTETNIKLILDCLAPLPVQTVGTALQDVDVDKEGSLTSASTASLDEKGVSSQRHFSTKTIVLADGTYASQAVYKSAGGTTRNTSPLRSMICSGDVLLATVTGVVLAKLFIRGIERPVSAQLRNQILFALTCLVKLAKLSDQETRLMHALRVVAEPSNVRLRSLCEKEWNSETVRQALTQVVLLETSGSAAKKVKPSSKEKTRKSSGVVFRQIKEKRELIISQDPKLLAALVPKEDLVETIPGVISTFGLSGGEGASSSLFAERISKATPMTGLADSVYIEGFLRLHSFDLILELSIVNRTGETLQNILVELCTNGDLKVVDKPAAVTLGPGESANVFATIKVSSTESGIVFGYATFDRKSALDKEWLVLNEIHADVVDYMQAGGQTQESTFKTMWQEFEWENKIAVNTNIREPEAFIELLSRHTNLQLVGSLERTRALLRSSQFVAVNMYAKSIFGEDALANVSLERNATSGDLGGTVRIRSRTQGIALSLGDKMTHVQREQKMRGA
jgi:coatomer subunit beta